MAAAFRIIPRSEWGAKHSAGFRAAPLPAKYLFIHHSVTIAPDLVPPFTDDFAAVRQLESIGQSRFGGGISYTFVITPAGLIFEGHGVTRQGAHTRGLNDVARAICHIGNYSSIRPTAKQLEATQWLIAEGKRLKWWPTNVPIDGHRNAPGASTECPGNYLYAALPQIRRPYSPQEGTLSATEVAEIKAHIDKKTAEVQAAINNFFYACMNGTRSDKVTPHGVGQRQLLAQITAVQTALAQMADADPNVPFDKEGFMAEITAATEAAVEKGIEEGLADLNIELSTDPAPTTPGMGGF